MIGVQVPGGVRLDSFPRLLVVDSVASDPNCVHSGLYNFSAATPIFHRGARGDTSLLQIGQRIAVWSDGFWLTSCPVQTSAVRIVILD